jgi:hypothetical protein
LVTTVAVLVGLMVWSAPAPARDPAPVTGVSAPGPIAAYGGRLVWSRPDGGGGYELVQRVGNGPVAKLPIRPRAVPFDVDLGPTSGGRVVAVYTRCAAEPKPAPDIGRPEGVDYQTGRGCDVHKLDVESGKEVRFTKANAGNATEFWPTYWKGRLAFARAYDSKPQYPYLYVKAVSSSQPSQRVPGGPRGTPDTGSSPGQLELYGKRLGFEWSYRSSQGTGTVYELRVDTAGDGHVLIDRRVTGLTAVLIGWPSFEDGRIYWSKGCFGDPTGCAGAVAQLRRGTYKSPLSHQQAAGPRFLLAHERDLGVTWVLQQASPGPETQWCASAQTGLPGSCVIQPLQPSYAATGKAP